MALLLTIYLVLHLCVGAVLPLRAGFKPPFFALVENAGLDLELRLNREMRPQSVRFVRGVVVALIMGAIALLIGEVVVRLAAMPYGWAFSLLFMACCINFMTPIRLMRDVIRRLDKNETAAAVALLQPYVKEPLAIADTHTVIRRAVELMALLLNRFLMAPCFWLLMAGPMGLSVYVVYAALDSAFGLKDDRRRSFSRLVRVISTVMNVFPSLLSAVVLMAASLFVSKSNPLRALSSVLGQAAADPKLWPILAVAGGLGVTLGGPVKHSDHYAEDRPWLGPKQSSARLTVADLKRAAILQYVFFVCVLGISSLFIMAIT